MTDNSQIRWHANLSYMSSLDWIYHSESMYEMKVKADLENIDLNDFDVLMFFVRTTTYHHAFWPHTAKRFTAFKNLLRYDKSIEESSRSKKMIHAVKAMCNQLKSDIENCPVRAPGHRQQLKDLQQVLDILKNPVKTRNKRNKKHNESKEVANIHMVSGQ